MLTPERIVIVVLLFALIYFGATIVRLENYHYAVQVGFCADVEISQRDKCLDEIQTRTNPIWHLIYALRIL